MLRKIVRRLLAPLVRWSSQGMGVRLFLSRCEEHGIAQSWVIEPWGKMSVSLTPDECRKWAANLYAIARDHEEGVPLTGEPEDDASDLRW